MSSKRWPAGTLARALVSAHRAYPLGTAPDLARMVDCDPACARVILRGLGIVVPKAKEQRLTWTPEMRAALLAGALNRRPIDRLADDIGVAPASLALGAFEVIRELACASS